MNRPLVGPGDRYRVRVELLHPAGGRAGVRHRAHVGVQLDKSDSHRYMVTLGTLCALVLVLGENGLTVEQVLLMEADRAVLRAVVTPGSDAPDWLPEESVYLLFEGDRRSVQQRAPRYLPLEGMVEERSWPQEEAVPLDSVAAAVGQAVNRANARLARACTPAGGAVVQSVTVRLSVHRADLCNGRVLVTLNSEAGGAGQFVEFTLSTAPALEGLEDADEVIEDEP